MLEGIGLGVGMIASGTFDVLGDNLPDDVSEFVTDFLGVCDIPATNGIPVNQPGLQRGRNGLSNNQKRQPVRQRNSTTSLAV